VCAASISTPAHSQHQMRSLSRGELSATQTAAPHKTHVPDRLASGGRASSALRRQTSGMLAKSITCAVLGCDWRRSVIENSVGTGKVAHRLQRIATDCNASPPMTALGSARRLSAK
jgi:hypothetical protein